MNSRLIGIRLYIENFIETEKGQDLVEYSMAFSVIALGTVAGMASVATAVLAVFSTITNIFTSKFN
ncbi:MAG TPA: hypothetical protein VGG56_10360 [Terracidiphilus sp.]